MYKKVRCTCEIAVLLIKPIIFLTFSLSSASLDLKVPIVLVDRRLAFGMDWTSGWDTDQDLSELIIPWNQG